MKNLIFVLLILFVLVVGCAQKDMVSDDVSLQPSLQETQDSGALEDAESALSDLDALDEDLDLDALDSLDSDLDFEI